MNCIVSHYLPGSATTPNPSGIDNVVSYVLTLKSEGQEPSKPDLIFALGSTWPTLCTVSYMGLS